MKLATKFFVFILAMVLSLGFFYSQKSYAEYPPNCKIEIIHENGQTITIVYGQDGGIIEVIISNND
jgi:hypothetical protein